MDPSKVFLLYQIIPYNKMSETKRFEVKKWNAVAMWGWDLDIENCAICRTHISDPCIDC